MPSYALIPPATGYADARRAWTVLTIAALWPVWSIAHTMAGFFTIDMPIAVDRTPNIWVLVGAVPWIGTLPLAGLAMATAVGASAWLAALFLSRPPRGAALARAALLVALAVPALLPSTQPIDFLPAAAFAALCGIRLGALVIGGFSFALIGAAPLGAVVIGAAIVLAARPFLASPANDNGLARYANMPFPA